MKMETVLFESDDIGKVKLHYKNGSKYIITNPSKFLVVQRIGGGCDVEYSQIVEEDTEYGQRTDITVFKTTTEDIVAFEAYNVTVFGWTFSKIYQRLMK